jgi:hypothetical protein
MMKYWEFFFSEMIEYGNNGLQSPGALDTLEKFA